MGLTGKDLSNWHAYVNLIVFLTHLGVCVPEDNYDYNLFLMSMFNEE